MPVEKTRTQAILPYHLGKYIVPPPGFHLSHIIIPISSEIRVEIQRRNYITNSLSTQAKAWIEEGKQNESFRKEQLPVEQILNILGT